MVKGKSGVIDIQTGGGEPGVVRDKSGHLVVVSIDIVCYYKCKFFNLIRFYIISDCWPIMMPSL